MPRTPISRTQPDDPLPPSDQGGEVISIRDLKAACASCSLRELCMPFGLTDEQLAHIDSLVGSRKRLRKGETLFDSGDGFTDLYAVWVGSLKTTVLAEDGREQVTGYQLPGDIIGLDGIGHDRHTGRAVALEDSEVCVLPFDRLEALARKVPALQHNLRRVLAREITRDQAVMLLLGSMRAEERVAAFLLDVAERYRQRGYSATHYVLRMTREEIGSFLGLKLETVSRLLSRFQQEGIVRIQGREVTILDAVALRELCGARV
jgi:CRP/FNR family transcriptional regulator, anaerobic regulatory protein